MGTLLTAQALTGLEIGLSRSTENYSYGAALARAKVFVCGCWNIPPDYRVRISQIKPESKTSSAERNRLCESLCSKGLVEYVDEIRQYQIAPPGKALLKSDTSTLPVSYRGA